MKVNMLDSRQCVSLNPTDQMVKQKILILKEMPKIQLARVTQIIVE